MHNRHTTISSIKLILILTTFSLLSCGGKSEVQVAEVEKQDGFQSYQLNIKSESIPFADLIDEIKITRLEETKESLLGLVRQVEFYNSKMFISGNDGVIYIFSNTGKFLNKINRKGEGPEEYSNWSDLWLEGETLALYNRQISINRYDLEGNFISREEMLEQAAHLYPYKSGYALDMNFQATRDTLKYSLITLGEDLKIENTFFPFSKTPGIWLFFSANSIFPIEEDLLYFPMMADMVYKIETDTVVPYIHYDFQDDWYFQPGVEISQEVFTEPEKTGQVWFMHNKIGENYIYLSATVGRSRNEAFLIDRKTNNNIRIDFETTSTEEYQISSVDWQGDELLISFQSTQLAGLLDQLDESQYSFTEGSTLEEIVSSENPALVWIKFKQR